MSRPFRDKNKDLVQLELLTSEEVWEKGKNDKFRLKRDLSYYGKVDSTKLSAFVCKANQKDKKEDFVEDVVKLPKKTKSEIVNFFDNLSSGKKHRKVVYLVKKSKNQGAK